MKFEKLEELYNKHIHDAHFQYKGLSEKELLDLAKLSFKRIPDDQKFKFQETWEKFCKGSKVEYNIEKALLYRFLAQTNLFFLCHLLEKYNGTTDNTHEEICNDFFVSKDPANYESFKRFATGYIALKQRMLLVPRGGFKSSIDMADTVQWIICFPEITILILTGVYNLAGDFVKEIKSHFTLQQNGENEKGKPIYGPRNMGDDTPSLFQVLFPEHCVPPQDGKATEFASPACLIVDKEPTVRAASIEQALSGMHFGIMKLDDVITNENSLTTDRMLAVNKQVSVNKAMLHPFGFLDVIGTWYDDQDFYGVTIRQEEKTAIEEGTLQAIVGSVDDGIFNSEVNWKIYLRSAWWPTEEARRLGKIEEEMTEKDYTLWFPTDANGIPQLTYKKLMYEKKTDPDGFAIKYLNNPRKVHQIKFPRELLVRRTIPASQLPHSGLIVTTVDTAYSTKSWADYTVIITALIYGGRFYIIDMARGRYNEYELPAMIAAVGYKWKPKRIAIEEDKGVRWMTRELRREMDKLQISIPVEYVSLGFGSKAKSKELKAKPVLRFLGDERLFFSNSCSGLDELYNELERFKGDDKGHDDIISALSILVDQFGSYADFESKNNYIQEQYVADSKAKARHDQVYGLGAFSKYNSNYAIDDNPITVYQTEHHQAEQLVDHDPLESLFG